MIGNRGTQTVYDEDILIRDRKQMLEEHAARTRDDTYNERELLTYMNTSNPENILDGKDSNSICACRKELVSNSGPGYVHFACEECFPGQCKWRMSCEPSKDCMFKAQTYVKISGRTTQVASCTRIEAQEDAARLAIEEEADLIWLNN